MSLLELGREGAVVVSKLVDGGIGGVGLEGEFVDPRDQVGGVELVELAAELAPQPVAQVVVLFSGPRVGVPA
ncbi:hypothetical protein Ari01nite_94100 [Paractinoplanes rishiriensis]|uniref:Uncharacterized protein n=1 Tax=Paractinoplanes rishiriensis TaxID=1050105 RepID=A0A919N1N8_9ACTN|nr:hypothetical protein Ari01nite_94100 [Actinoplanes rishiriensis]